MPEKIYPCKVLFFDFAFFFIISTLLDLCRRMHRHIFKDQSSNGFCCLQTYFLIETITCSGKFINFAGHDSISHQVLLFYNFCFMKVRQQAKYIGKGPIVYNSPTSCFLPLTLRNVNNEYNFSGNFNIALGGTQA